MTSDLALLEHDFGGQAEPCWRASQAEPRHSARPHGVSVTLSRINPVPPHHHVGWQAVTKQT